MKVVTDIKTVVEKKNITNIRSKVDISILLAYNIKHAQYNHYNRLQYHTIKIVTIVYNKV